MLDAASVCHDECSPSAAQKAAIVSLSSTMNSAELRPDPNLSGSPSLNDRQVLEECWSSIIETIDAFLAGIQ